MRLLRLAGYKQDMSSRARVLGDFFRTKSYLKDFEALCQTHPRRWPNLGVPPLSAAARLGCSPNHCNETLILNLAGCTMHCWFCFAASMLDAGDACVWKASEEGVWNAAMPCLTIGTQRVFRISGGEPLMQQPAIVDLLGCVDNELGLVEVPPYIWLDTNLSIPPSPELIRALKQHRGGAGVAACFKGWHNDDVALNIGEGKTSLDSQFDVARLWWASGLDVYFFIVDSSRDCVPSYRRQQIARAFVANLIARVGILAPLKTGVLPIHEHYLCATRAKPEGVLTNVMEPHWIPALYDYFEPEMLWVPPHQITPEIMKRETL